MLYKELEDCSQCPLLGEMCTGGMTSSPGGIPIEPPCVGMSWNPDDDMDDIYDRMVDGQRRCEESEDRRWKREEEKRKVKEERTKKARETRMVTYSETKQITRLHRQIRNNIKFLSLTRSYASAINFTNEMFGYEERIVEKKKNPLEIENEKLQEKIDELLKVKKEKLKELRIKRKQDKS